jgi:hypothetical protein
MAMRHERERLCVYAMKRRRLVGLKPQLFIFKI